MESVIDCNGPDEAGVCFAQICYDALKLLIDKYQSFDFLFCLVNRDQSVDDTMSNLKETWVRFLETCQLIDIICPLL